ncbi:hypothetical protein BKA63DRAFT_584095 [Paraphoma chrysanthemicola]|nr:hypothetical protein BKA63DRAFT_584095 [Paraphoma chrysanthemicola]
MPPTLASDPDLLPGMIILSLIAWAIVFFFVTYWKMIMMLEDDWTAMDSGDAWLLTGWREGRRDTGAATNMKAGAVEEVKKEIVVVPLRSRNVTGAEKNDDHVLGDDQKNGKSEAMRYLERTNISHHAMTNIPTPGEGHTHWRQDLHRIHTARKVEDWMHKCQICEEQGPSHRQSQFVEEHKEKDKQEDADASGSKSLDKNPSKITLETRSDFPEVQGQENQQTDNNANNKHSLQIDMDMYNSSDSSTSASTVIYTPPESGSDKI